MPPERVVKLCEVVKLYVNALRRTLAGELMADAELMIVQLRPGARVLGAKLQVFLLKKAA